MPEHTYLFIDGGHLRNYYAESVRKWFGEDGQINFDALKTQMGAHKCFYYDCLDDIRRSNETEVEFEARQMKQEMELNRIRNVHGTHVRLGSLAGNEKTRRQKEVDILLAVDMMNHAVRQNMTRAVLLSGDRDFKPLIESLVQMGLFVIVAADFRHISNELARAADGYREIKFHDYHTWSAPHLRNKFPIPSLGGGTPDLSGWFLLKTGTIGGISSDLYQSSDNYLVLHKRSDSVVHAQSAELERLTLFCELEFGNIFGAHR